MDNSDMCLYSSPDASIIETSSVEDEGVFFSFGKISSFAKSINKNIESVAHSINSSAKAFMNELVEMEQEAAMVSMSEEQDEYSNTVHDSSTFKDANGLIRKLPFPWEINSISTTEQEELKGHVLNLSKNEHLLLQPFESDSISDLNFRLDEDHIELIDCLMKLDPNLSKVFSKISGRKNMNEEMFWRNYFYQCNKLQEINLICRDEEFDDEEILTENTDENVEGDFVFVQEEDLY